MAKVHYSSLAAKDLWENAEYIARDKPDAAYRWVESIEKTCELLAGNPELGERRKTGRFARVAVSPAAITSSSSGVLRTVSKLFVLFGASATWRDCNRASRKSRRLVREFACCYFFRPRCFAGRSDSRYFRPSFMACSYTGSCSKVPATRSHQGSVGATASILRRSTAISSSSAATRFSSDDEAIGRFLLYSFSLTPACTPNSWPALQSLRGAPASRGASQGRNRRRSARPRCGPPGRSEPG